MSKPKPPIDWAGKLTRAADNLTDYLESLERKRTQRPARELPFFAWLRPEHIVLLCSVAQAAVGVCLLTYWMSGAGALSGFLALVSFAIAAALYQRIRFALHANLILSALSLITIPLGSIMAIFMSGSSEQAGGSAGLGSIGVLMMVFLAITALSSLAALWQDR